MYVLAFFIRNLYKLTHTNAIYCMLNVIIFYLINRRFVYLSHNEDVFLEFHVAGEFHDRTGLKSTTEMFLLFQVYTK